jgi:hypothetical protein
MKKFVMGLILGAALSFTVSANAEEIKSLIGKQVDGETTVLLDGVELPVQAAIIEGTTYAPVRAIGEAVGKKVDWREGKVTLDTKTVDEMRAETQKLISEGLRWSENAKKREALQKQVQEIADSNTPYTLIIMQYEGAPEPDRKYTEQQYLDAKKKHEENIKKIRELDAQIEETYK